MKLSDLLILFDWNLENSGVCILYEGIECDEIIEFNFRYELSKYIARYGDSTITSLAVNHGKIAAWII